MPQVNEFSWLFSSLSFFSTVLIFFLSFHYLSFFSIFSPKNVSFYLLNIF